MSFKSKKLKNDEIRPAIEKMTEMGLTIVSTPELKELYQSFSCFYSSMDSRGPFCRLHYYL